MKTFEEYVTESESADVSDRQGPGGGKLLSQITDVDTHTKAMQYHSTKYNAIKRKTDKTHEKDADHVRDTAMKYHGKMYHAHKAAVESMAKP